MSKKQTINEQNLDNIPLSPRFRSNYDYVQTPGLECLDPSLTQQQFKDDSDVNNILKKFALTGHLPGLIASDAHYGDFSAAPDYHEALTTVLHSQAQFSALSAVVRRKFDNDPEKFLSFVNDPKNIDEMITLGMAVNRNLPLAAATSSALKPATDPTPSKPS